MADGILNPIEQLEAEIDFDVYTKQEVDALLDEKADKSDTYTKTETDALLDDKADADSVYTKTETDTLLSAKADKSTTLAGYGITDAYTKTQTDTLLNGKADADSVYTKQEIDTKIPSSVGSATKPVYVNGGVITECTYELNKTVPANAVFTDTTYTAGNGLNLIGTSFSAKAGANVSVDSGGINVNGNGVVASADSGLVSGGTAYTELRPTLDGTWVKNAQTTAINLQKLEGGIEYLYGLLSHQYDQLKKYINGNYYDYDTDTDSKYTKTVPQGAMPYASLEQIGGRTLVWNQLQKNTLSRTSGGVVFTFDSTDGSLTISEKTPGATRTSTAYWLPNESQYKYELIGGHKYYSKTVNTHTGVQWFLQGYAVNSIITYPSTMMGNVYCSVSPSADLSTPVKFYPQVFDLTLMYGSGNEPTTVEEFTAQFPAQYYPYNAGTLLSAGVTEVVSKKADTTEIATYPIPAEIRNLEGYGWSAGNVYNYIDYERKVFVKNVDRANLGSLTWQVSGSHFYTSALSAVLKSPPTNSTVANILNQKYVTKSFADLKLYTTPCCSAYPSNVQIYDTNYTLDAGGIANLTSDLSGVYLYYELATPVEVDISAYLTDDNLIEVEPNGTLTFPNSNGTDYQIPVPSAETYMVNLQGALGE